MAAITGLEKVSFGPEKVMHRAMDQNYVRNGSRLEVHLTGLSEDMKDLSYSFEAYYGQY